MRYLMTFSYDGSNFFGYQKQPKKRTIQGAIEEVLREINGGIEVNLYSSGRTDALVHAINQKAHFDMGKNITCKKLLMGINSLLPDDIYVKKIEVVDDTFNARFDVFSKEYIYILNVGEFNPIERNYVYQYNRNLDLVSIEKGISYFEGEHNFKSFTKASTEIDNYNRCIYAASVSRENDKIIFRFVGNGFLRYMVRNMVGLLIEIGEGKKQPDDVTLILAKEDRRMAGKTAPACGLYLKEVHYNLT